MKLLDYHRLHHEEELTWDRERLREQAGTAFVEAAESLLPTHEEPWSRDNLVHFSRSESFEHCVRLCALYSDGTDAQRTWLRSRIDGKIAGKLRLFGLRAAVLAGRERSPALSRDGLVAFAISDLSQTDIRDYLIGLSLLCHCARLGGADVPALFREVAVMAGPAIRVLYEEWAEQYPNVARIGSMGWKEVTTEEGVGFRQ